MNYQLFLNVEANSTARKVLLHHIGNSQGVVSINTYYPVLENFPYEKMVWLPRFNKYRYY